MHKHMKTETTHREREKTEDERWMAWTGGSGHSSGSFVSSNATAHINKLLQYYDTWTIMLRNQPSRPTQSLTLSGMGNKQ